MLNNCVYIVCFLLVSVVLLVLFLFSVVVFRLVVLSCVNMWCSVFIGNCVCFVIFGSDYGLLVGLLVVLFSVVSVVMSVGLSGDLLDFEVIGLGLLVGVVLVCRKKVIVDIICGVMFF